tara:strand:+ start:60 stop:644 length:585 start_codon:yes stop_codon:yes gene_type:complete
MLQMYKVFEPKKEVIFINNKNQLGNSLKGDRNKNAYENEVTEYVFSEEPYDELKKYYADHKLIKAAGGLVQNNGYFLWIYRNNIWDLPKGKIEDNESITEAALREVEEECGLKGILEISHKIIVTHHTYQPRDVKILKETHWFFMNFDGVPNTIPQLEEGITEVSWKSKDDSIKLAKVSYPSILSVFNTGIIIP